MVEEKTPLSLQLLRDFHLEFPEDYGHLNL